MRSVLNVSPWAVQEEICRKLLEPPYRVLVKAGHSVGKTWLSAAIVSWFYDTFNPSCAITTAPTHRDVCDLLWREIRLQRHHIGGFRGNSAPELWEKPDHYAKGFTASKGESFVGRHQERMLFVFDEAVGVDQIFWETTKSMFKPDGLHHWLAIFNPTDASSQAAMEERLGGWHVVTMSALDHPNIAAELAKQPQPFPAAVSLAQVASWLRDWAEPIDESERKATDIEFPPGSGIWLRPGPLCEARVLGRWPSQAAYSVWSDALWQTTLAARHELDERWAVQIGCDVARFGDDLTAIHVRKGRCSIHHEAHNGWSTDKTAARLKQLCHEYAGKIDQRRVKVAIDVGGVGGGVIDQADGFNFISVNSNELARQETRFTNVRSELWWAARDVADKGELDISRLSQKSQLELGRQLMAPMYALDMSDRIRVEEKAQTKKRLKCSPDHADAFNLAYYPVHSGNERVSGIIG